MATPSGNEQSEDAESGEPDVAGGAPYTFNPLKDDLSDLFISHQHCWLWPQIKLEMDRLDDILADVHPFIEPLTVPDCAWGQAAAFGIARSNAAIHQHAERYDSYPLAARSLWTTHIPATSPTLTDAQIYAILAIHEARMAAEAYCEIAAGIEEEMADAGIGHDDTPGIDELRSDFAGWERGLWHSAAQQTGTAEKFLLMAGFAATTSDSSAIKKAEAQIAKLQRRARKAEAAAEPFQGGRQRGAVGKLTKALRAIVEQVGSRDIADVLPAIQAACDDFPIEGIQFQDYNDDFVWYLDVVLQSEAKIKINSLKRKLERLQDI